MQGYPGPQARRAAERVDERMPPCGGSLGEAARLNTTEAFRRQDEGTRRPDANTNG